MNNFENYAATIYNLYLTENRVHKLVNNVNSIISLFHLQSY